MRKKIRFAKNINLLMVWFYDSMIDMAESIGIVDKSTFECWLNGNHEPNLKYQIEISREFGISLEVLLRGTEQELMEAVKGYKRRPRPKRKISCNLNMKCKTPYATKVRKLMVDNGMTITKLAEKIEVDPKTVAEWFSRGKMPRGFNALRVAYLFGIPALNLIEENV